MCLRSLLGPTLEVSTGEGSRAILSRPLVGDEMPSRNLSPARADWSLKLRDL